MADQPTTQQQPQEPGDDGQFGGLSEAKAKLREDFFTTADALLAEKGVRPTQAEIVLRMKEVYGRAGSPNDIGPWFRIWRRTGTAPVKPVQVEVPDDLKTLFDQAVASLSANCWTKATQLASAAYQEKSDALDAIRKQMEEDLKESDEAQTQNAVVIEALKTDLAKETASHEALKLDHDALQGKLGVAENDLRVSEDQLHSANATVAELRERVAQLEAHYQTEQKARAAADEKVLRLTAQVATLAAELKAEQTRSAEASQRAEAAAAQAQKISADLVQTTRSLDAATAKIEAEQALTADARKREAEAAKQVQALTAEMSTTKRSLDACTARVESAGREITTYKEQAASDRAEARKAQDEAVALRTKLDAMLKDSKAADKKKAGDTKPAISE